MKQELVNFYETKYMKERDESTLHTISYEKFPSTRYEAVYKYFTDNFKSGSILELGAGNGNVASSILKSNPEITRYMATDLSENRLKNISDSISDKRLETLKIDVENFDFNTVGKFDAIIMVALIEHLIDPISVMKNIKSALKPGGFVYIETPNIADYGSRFKLLRGRFPSTASKEEGLTTYYNEDVALFDEGHLHYFTYSSLSKMLIRYAGFSKTEKYYYAIGRIVFGKAFHHMLARWKPELFSMLVLIGK